MKKTVITLVLLIVLIVCLVAVAGIHNDNDQSDDLSHGESNASSSSNVSDDGSTPETPSTPDTSFTPSADASGEASDDPPAEHVLGCRYLSDKNKYLLTVDGVAVEDEQWDFIEVDMKMGEITATFGIKGDKYYYIHTDLTREEFVPKPWLIRSVGNIEVTCEINFYEGELVGINEVWSYTYQIVKDGKSIEEFVTDPMFFKDYVVINPFIVAVGDIADGFCAKIYDGNGILRNDDHGVAYTDERSDYLITYDEKWVEDDFGEYLIDGIPHRLETFYSVLSTDLETVYTSKSTVRFDELGGLCVYDTQSKQYVPVEIN